MPARKGQEIWSVDIIHDRNRIVVSGNVIARNANRPFVFVKIESLFQSEIQTKVSWKSPRIRAADKLLLVVHDAERKPGVIFGEVAAQQLPYRQRPPSS